MVAAGNSTTDAANFQPANCNDVITVAATDRNGNRADYSNYGATVEISAPGGDTTPITADGILSALNTGTQGPVADTYVYYQGTSMAAPHVSGVAALLVSLTPSLTPAQVLQMLQSSVTPFPAGSTCTTSLCGKGILNAGKAVALKPYENFLYLPLVLKALKESTPTPGFWESPSGDEFYVTTDGLKVDNFAIYVSVTGCGNFKITHTAPEPISNNRFEFTGSFYATGTFTSDTAGEGTDGLSQFEIPGCGIVSGGPWAWEAVWKNSSQPAQLLKREAQVVVQKTGEADPNLKSNQEIKIKP